MTLEIVQEQSATSEVVDFLPNKMAPMISQPQDQGSLEEDATQCTDLDSDDSWLGGNNFAHVKNINIRGIGQAKKSRSILKHTEVPLTEYVCLRKKSWKSLPVPDLKDIEKAKTDKPLNENGTALPIRRIKSAVTFNEIQVRKYDQTIGDHPCTSYGPPICLDWTFEESAPVNLDDYEENRGQRRTMRQMMMNYYTRKNTLMWTYGHSEAELKKAARATERAQFQRGVTKYFLPYSKVEEVVASAARKTKRALRRQSATV